MTAARWTLTSLDGSSEVLTVVRIDGCSELCVEVAAGPEIGDDFVGLYDMNGAQIQTPDCSWEAVDEGEIPSTVIEGFPLNWERGNSTITRLT